MWVSRARYEALIKAEERAEWLRVRVNQLELQVADHAFQATGVPQRALEIGGPVAPKIHGGVPLSAQTPVAALADSLGVSFDDLGDGNDDQ